MTFKNLVGEVTDLSSLLQRRCRWWQASTEKIAPILWVKAPDLKEGIFWTRQTTPYLSTNNMHTTTTYKSTRLINPGHSARVEEVPPNVSLLAHPHTSHYPRVQPRRLNRYHEIFWPDNTWPGHSGFKRSSWRCWARKLSLWVAGSSSRLKAPSTCYTNTLFLALALYVVPDYCLPTKPRDTVHVITVITEVSASLQSRIFDSAEVVPGEAILERRYESIRCVQRFEKQHPCCSKLVIYERTAPGLQRPQ